MEVKKLIYPNKQKVLVGLLFFLLIGATSWVHTVYSLIFYKTFFFEFTKIIFALLVGYVLASYFVTYFDKIFFNELSLGTKLIGLYFFFLLVKVVLYIVSGFFSSNMSAFTAKGMTFAGNPTIYTIFLLISIVFLLSNHQKKYLLASSFFLYLLLNPLDSSGNLFLRRGSNGFAHGILINTLSFKGDFNNFLYGLITMLFPLIVTIYFYLKHKGKEKPSFETAMLVLIVISYLLHRFAYLLFR